MACLAGGLGCREKSASQQDAGRDAVVDAQQDGPNDGSNDGSNDEPDVRLDAGPDTGVDASADVGSPVDASPPVDGAPPPDAPQTVSYPYACSLAAPVKLVGNPIGSLTQLWLAALSDGWVMNFGDKIQILELDGTLRGSGQPVSTLAGGLTNSAGPVGASSDGIWALYNENFINALQYTDSNTFFGRFDAQASKLSSVLIGNLTSPAGLATTPGSGGMALWTTGFSTGLTRVGVDVYDASGVRVGGMVDSVDLSFNNFGNASPAPDGYVGCVASYKGLLVYRSATATGAVTKGIISETETNPMVDVRRCAIAVAGDRVVGIFSPWGYNSKSINHSASVYVVDTWVTPFTWTGKPLSIGAGDAVDRPNPIVTAADVVAQNGVLVIAFRFQTKAGMAMGVGVYDRDGTPLSAPLKLEEVAGWDSQPNIEAAPDGSFGVAYQGPTPNFRLARVQCAHK
jgi:hypothetical protein